MDKLEQIRNRRLKINALLVVLAMSMLNISNLLVFFTGTNRTILHVVFMISIFVASLINNNWNMKIKNFYVLSVIIIFCLINMLIVSFKTIIIDEIFRLIIYGLLSMHIASYKFSYNKLIEYMRISAIVQLVVAHFVLGAIINREFNYMHFGFISNFIVLACLINNYFNKNKIDKIIIIYIFILGVLFGNRGAILTNLFLFIYFFFIKFKNKPIILITITFLIVIFLVLIEFKLVNILYWLNDTFPNINSYSLRKMINSLEQGSIDLSNRDMYYEAAIQMIKDKFYFLPNGFGRFTYLTGLYFPHNFIIEAYMIFGSISIVVLLYLINCFIKICTTKKRKENIIIIAILIYTLSRLLTGGSLITEIPLWISIGILINFKNIINLD